MWSPKLKQDKGVKEFVMGFSIKTNTLEKKLPTLFNICPTLHAIQEAFIVGSTWNPCVCVKKWNVHELNRCKNRK